MKLPHALAPGLALTAIVAFAACGDGVTSPVEPESAVAVEAQPLAAASVMDISGDWEWRETLLLVLRPDAAIAFFGITPEGKHTRVTCNSGGTMNIVQTGQTFSGSATQTSECTTRGGQAFDPFPPTLPVLNGEIRGHTMRFQFSDGPIPNFYRASARVENGVAVALNGNARTIVPGHPQSPLPVPPPPAGPGSLLEWEATR